MSKEINEEVNEAERIRRQAWEKAGHLMRKMCQKMAKFREITVKSCMMSSSGRKYRNKMYEFMIPEEERE